MNDEVRALIESLRRGQYEDPAEKISLLSAALREHGADLATFLTLLRAPQIPLRLAAIDASRGRSEPELISELVRLAEDEEARVREKLAGALEGHTAKAAANALRTLAQDGEWEVRRAALKSTTGCSQFAELQQAILESDPDWRVRLAAVNALGDQRNHIVVRGLLQVLANDSDEDVARRCAEIIEKRLATTRAAVEKLLPTDIGQLGKAEHALKALGGQRFPKLLEWLTAQTTVKVDPQTLARFGTDLTALAEEGSLPRAYGLEEPCEALLRLLGRERWRSIALLGASGSGKSALVNQLVCELAKPENGSWRVLRVSPSDFMAGTKYIGEWETRVHELIEAVRKPRRVLVYVPNLSDLSAAGTTSKSDSNVAAALAPYLEEGTVVLLGESTPEEFERGLGRTPSLQRLFDKVLVPEASPEQTQRILTAVAGEYAVSVPESVLTQLYEVSTQFLSHLSRPGNAVTVLRAVLQKAKDSSRPLCFRDVLDSLSRSTGLPADLLDDSIPLRQPEVRAFFEKRIIGQSEPVDAVVDLVTLIKAGLTDPHKPLAVMLFVGPTGVGKTELARALAEYIFGDATRLTRFDMSEFASTDGFLRLIGTANENGLLTDAVRQQPFSVLLLDEIEKSHVNVFDLCLQIFDAGRLTDGRGRTVDFRRSIVILTSNIGATAPAPVLGFQHAAAASPPATADPDRTFRELTRCFRPEFLNRLDRIVHFRPLSLEVAEQIARREIEMVLGRSGIRRRDLSVELDPAVISLLLREGYSPHFGARPLKRTVERLVLLPLARAISCGVLQNRTLLRLAQQDGRISVSIVRPPSPRAPHPTEEERAAQSLESETADLKTRFDALSIQVQPLADRKSELIQQTQAAGFYQDTACRAATFDEIRKLDQFLALHQGLGKALTGVGHRLREHPVSRSDEAALRERLAQFRAELEQLCLVAASKNVRDLGDVLVCLTLVERSGPSIGAVERLAGMYTALAQRRRMTAEVLGEFFDGKQDRAWLLISGLGAYASLNIESGLHQMDHRVREKKQRTGREAVREDRETVRVEILPLANEPDKAFRQAVKARVLPVKPAPGRLVEQTAISVSLFHEPSLRSLDLRAGVPKEKAIENAFLVLHTLVVSAGAAEIAAAGQIVRHYDLGISPRVKDTRSGRSTSRVDRVFKGYLDTLLPQVTALDPEPNDNSAQ